MTQPETWIYQARTLLGHDGVLGFIYGIPLTITMNLSLHPKSHPCHSDLRVHHETWNIVGNNKRQHQVQQVQ